MHWYIAPMVSSIFLSDDFKIFYYLPSPFYPPPLRYEVGPKSWSNSSVYNALRKFGRACDMIDRDGMFDIEKFLAGYSWLNS